MDQVVAMPEESMNNLSKAELTGILGELFEYPSEDTEGPARMLRRMLRAEIGAEVANRARVVAENRKTRGAGKVKDSGPLYTRRAKSIRRVLGTDKTRWDMDNPPVLNEKGGVGAEFADNLTDIDLETLISELSFCPEEFEARWRYDRITSVLGALYRAELLDGDFAALLEGLAGELQ